MAPRLKLIENSVPCELGVIGMICGVEAQGALASRITRCLAGAANDVEAETSLQRLEALQGSDLYNWALRPRNRRCSTRRRSWRRCVRATWCPSTLRPPPRQTQDITGFEKSILAPNLQMDCPYEFRGTVQVASLCLLLHSSVDCGGQVLGVCSYFQRTTAKSDKGEENSLRRIGDAGEARGVGQIP